MASVRQFPPIRSQVAEHLRRELAHGRWSGVMPGSNRLARELGVSRKRVGRMVRQTATDAWVVGAGSREVLDAVGDVCPPRCQHQDYVVLSVHDRSDEKRSD